MKTGAPRGSGVMSVESGNEVSIVQRAAIVQVSNRVSFISCVSETARAASPRGALDRSRNLFFQSGRCSHIYNKTDRGIPLSYRFMWVTESL